MFVFLLYFVLYSMRLFGFWLLSVELLHYLWLFLGKYSWCHSRKSCYGVNLLPKVTLPLPNVLELQAHGFEEMNTKPARGTGRQGTQTLRDVPVKGHLRCWGWEPQVWALAPPHMRCLQIPIHYNQGLALGHSNGEGKRKRLLEKIKQSSWSIDRFFFSQLGVWELIQTQNLLSHLLWGTVMLQHHFLLGRVNFMDQKVPCSVCQIILCQKDT